MITELYNVPRGSRIQILDEAKVPIGGLMPEVGEELNFKNVDGMYSYCTRDNGDIVHLVAWAKVKILD